MIRKLLLITTLLGSLTAMPALAQNVALDPEPDASELFPESRPSSPAEEEEDDSASYQRIVNFEYYPSDIYSIPTKCGYQTSIVFADDEEIQTISVGDRSTWQIIPSGSRLFIRPLVEGVATNMTVITSKRSYQFDISSAKGKRGRVIYVATFTYKKAEKALAAASAAETEPVAPPPQGTAETVVAPFYAAPSPYISPSEKSPATAAVAIPVADMSSYSGMAPAPGALNHNYTFSGPDSLAPAHTYDNGISTTYVRYVSLPQPLPSAYVVDAEGREIPVPARVEDGVMAIDTIAGELRLVRPEGTVHLYNENINPR